MAVFLCKNNCRSLLPEGKVRALFRLGYCTQGTTFLEPHRLSAGRKAMPNAPRPSLNRLPRPFDPSILARAIIALPLMEAIQEELAVTANFKNGHEAAVLDHDAALFYEPDFPGGEAAAYEAVLPLLQEAAAELKAEGAQRIDPPDPAIDKDVSLARLDGAVLRLLLSLDQEQEHRAIKRSWPTLFEVIIDVNLAFKPRVDAAAAQGGVDVEPDARKAAKELIAKHIETAKQNLGVTDSYQVVDRLKTGLSNQYVFARLDGRVIQELVKVDEEFAKATAEQERVAGLTPEKEISAQPTAKQKGKGKAASKAVAAPPAAPPSLTRFRAIFHIWPDFVIQSCIYRSQATIKADAAQRAFTAFGKDITWAVMDSGIDKDHPHFAKHKNIDPASPYHADYTGVAGAGIDSALTDTFGHGTHVAGIIAGEQNSADHVDPINLLAVSRELDANGQPLAQKQTLEAVSGMAPKCQLVSMKVLDKFGQGSSSNLMAAIAQIQSINGHGRELHIHGVNISLGYPFEPKWFACGYSPLCVEINRLVKSGVVVVITAGNTGYGVLSTSEGASEAALDLTINDPGNAEYAITVGSTHRDMPHMYGVSYFSSKGPTGDGRLKPDLLAPGEKIVSCAAKGSKLAQKEAGAKPTDPDDQTCRYLETSGTSMAAPHVSGAIAAFLSIRREYIGEPEKVKAIFTSTATDLGRDRNFQGAGVIDLMRAIQSV